MDKVFAGKNEIFLKGCGLANENQSFVITQMQTLLRFSESPQNEGVQTRKAAHQVSFSLHYWWNYADAL